VISGGAFIAVQKQPTTTCTWRLSSYAVFMDGRDNGPAMTVFILVALRVSAPLREISL